jgi:mersacidin/lichenicidin family type 2 lantibiotic
MAKKLTIDVVRAWKDPMYRKRLTPLEIASLPPNPAGDNQVDKEELVRAVRSWVEFLDSCGGYTDNVTFWSCHCNFSEL